jgi:hypothetical protein
LINIMAIASLTEDRDYNITHKRKISNPPWLRLYHCVTYKSDMETNRFIEWHQVLCKIFKAVLQITDK